MNRTVAVHIDADRCNGCGRCIPVCPSQTLVLRKGKAVVAGNQSLSCGHCAAACPEAAISIEGLDPQTANFSSFEIDQRWLPFGQYDVRLLTRLMASRRSCRNYKTQRVPKRLLEDLIRIAVTAPSGTNSQCWQFTVLPDRQRVEKLAYGIGRFFKRLNRWARNPLIRHGLKLIGDRALDEYYRNHYDSVVEGLSDWELKGRDRLFHGAPGVIVVGSRPGASCPAEDALLATQNLLLGAHALGLGTCLIGFAAAALQKSKTLKQSLAIHPTETIHAVVALGFPSERYRSIAYRKPINIRYA